MIPNPPPGAGKRHMRVHGLTGWDRVLDFLPLSLALPRVARLVIAAWGPPAGPGDLTFSFKTSGVVEVVDSKGTIRRK